MPKPIKRASNASSYRAPLTPPSNNLQDELIFPELPDNYAPTTPFIPPPSYVDPIDEAFLNANQYNVPFPPRTPAPLPFMDDSAELPPISSQQLAESEAVLGELLRKSGQESPAHAVVEPNKNTAPQKRRWKPTGRPPGRPKKTETAASSLSSPPSRKRRIRRSAAPPPPEPESDDNDDDNHSQSDNSDAYSENDNDNDHDQHTTQQQQKDHQPPAKRQRKTTPRIPFRDLFADEDDRQLIIDLCASNIRYFNLIKTKMPGLSEDVNQAYPGFNRQVRKHAGLEATIAHAASSDDPFFPMPSVFRHTPNQFWKNYDPNKEKHALWLEQDPAALDDLCPKHFEPFAHCDRLPVFQRQMPDSLPDSFFSLLNRHLFQLVYRPGPSATKSNRGKMLYLNRNGPTNKLPITPFLNNIINIDECVQYSNQIASSPDTKLILRDLDAYLRPLRDLYPTGFNQATLFLLSLHEKGTDALKRLVHTHPYTLIALPFPDPNAAAKGFNHKLRFSAEYGDNREFTFLDEGDDPHKLHEYRSIELGVAYHVVPLFNGLVTSLASEITTKLNCPVLLIMVQ